MSKGELKIISFFLSIVLFCIVLSSLSFARPPCPIETHEGCLINTLCTWTGSACIFTDPLRPPTCYEDFLSCTGAGNNFAKYTGTCQPINCGTDSYCDADNGCTLCPAGRSNCNGNAADGCECFCGDNIVQSLNGETCDNGNGAPQSLNTLSSTPFMNVHNDVPSLTQFCLANSYTAMSSTSTITNFQGNYALWTGSSWSTITVSGSAYGNVATQIACSRPANGVHCSVPTGGSCTFCNSSCNYQTDCSPGYSWNGHACQLFCPSSSVGTVNAGCHDSSVSNAYGTSTYYCPTSTPSCYFCNPGYHWDGASCISPCTITDANLIPSGCSAYGCVAGNSLTASITYSGNCSTASFLQMDVSSGYGNCMIQYSGVNMKGVFFPSVGKSLGTFVASSSPHSYSYYYTIPAIPAACAGKSLTTITAVLRDGPP